MAYVNVDDENRITAIMWDDKFVDSLPEEDRSIFLDTCPIRLFNDEILFNIAHDSDRDFIVENGIARYDALPESRKRIEAEFREHLRQAKLENILEAVDNGTLVISE